MRMIFSKLRNATMTAQRFKPSSIAIRTRWWCLLSCGEPLVFE
ncbi:hypothetical protein PVAP13_6NG010831 [Panicum virgatum]|uniref:Uncharacterized protein n=2 Tax=Panicum virgatum TaxID=38727 RepID=A0A8T0QSL7_PANVG|nr:hypothetical protein PVAP13_6NG010831 [Panicum virgatum]